VNETTITAPPGTPFIDIVREFDATPGGRHRYVHRDESGEYSFRGVFHSVFPSVASRDAMSRLDKVLAR
jgi:hypothetical protein